MDETTKVSTMPAPGDQILRIEEAAAEIRMPLATMRHLKAHNRGPRFWKLGRRVVVYRRDLDAWLAQQYETTA